MRVLVTGAAGFIARHAIQALLGRGHEVVALVRPGRSPRLIDGVSVVHADLNDQAATRAAISAARADATLHAAWFTDPNAYLSDARENLLSLAASLHLATTLVQNGCRSLVLVGTGLEATAGRPDASVYAKTKAAAHHCTAFLSNPSFTVVCAHVFWLYGPGEDPRRVVPTVARAALDGRTVDVTSGHHLRPYLHVEDVASALVAVVESDVSGGVDICSNEETRLSDVFDAIGRATGRPDLIRRGARPEPAGFDLDVVGDPTQLQTLGWSPSLPLDEGISRTVAILRGSSSPHS